MARSRPGKWCGKKRATVAATDPQAATRITPRWRHLRSAQWVIGKLNRTRPTGTVMERAPISHEERPRCLQ